MTKANAARKGRLRDQLWAFLWAFMSFFSSSLLSLALGLMSPWHWAASLSPMLSSFGQRGADLPPHQFLLEDLEANDGLEDGADDEGAVLVSGALSSLTILPASNPLVVCYK